MSGITTSVNISDNMSRLLREMALNMERFAMSAQRSFLILDDGLELGQMETQLQARLGSDNNGTALFKHLQEQAKASSFNIKQLYKNTSNFLSIVENSKQLDKLNRFTEQLALFDTTGQGLDGVGLLIKEALNGDIVSLATRFNMSESLITSLNIHTLGKEGNIDGFITQFEKLLEMQRMGESAYNKMLESPKVKIDMFLSNLKTDFAEAGKLAAVSLNPIIDKFETWYQSDMTTEFFNSVRSGLSWIIVKGYEFVNFIESIGTVAGTSLAVIKQEFGSVIRYVMSANGTLGTLQNALISTANSLGFRKAMSLCSSAIMSIAKAATWVINTIDSLNQRFDWLLPIIVSITTKIYLFNAINGVLTYTLNTVINCITSVKAAYTALSTVAAAAAAALTGLNAAIDANAFWLAFKAIVAVVSAIGALIFSVKALKQEAQLDSTEFETTGGYSAEIIARSRMTGYSVEAVQQMNDVSQGYKKRIEAEEQKIRDEQKAFDTARSNYLAFTSTSGAGIPAAEKESYKKSYSSALQELEKQKKESERNIKLYKSQRDETIAMIGEQDKLGKTLDKDKILEDFKLDFDMPGLNNLGDIDNVGSVGSVDKINDTVDIASEDLQYFRDAAEALIIDRSTINTIVPQIQVSFGDVRETADLGKVEDYIKQAIQNGLNTSPELIVY